MPGTASLAVFLLAALALNISPGPDMLYVISRSLEQGRRAVSYRRSESEQGR